MLEISSEDIKLRIARDNPWWAKEFKGIPEGEGLRRVYFDPFKTAALNFDVKRAVVLLGPRRVGKTYMLKQLIHEAILQGINRNRILYVSVDTPIYVGISLEKFLSFLPDPNNQSPAVIIFDEIQYHADWERHLKDLVDSFPNIKFVASGSAAAALKLASRESGAGRFTDFMLPSLTFYEFLKFFKEEQQYIEPVEAPAWQDQFKINDISGLNARFADYLNYGGYPEVVVNNQIRNDPDQFIRNDIIDKILLKDLPILYGISDVQELNKLFSVLAYHAGSEVNLENISQSSGLTKPTLKKYVEYLESAFLIMKVASVDDGFKSFKRERNFKVYLNNPSMRAALFAPVKLDETDRMGRLAECAIFSQWQHSHSFRNIRYARWKNEGEVDIVYMTGDQRPIWIGEIKWSDRVETHYVDELKSVVSLLKRQPNVREAIFTTKTISKRLTIEGRPVTLLPCAAYCYMVGRNVTKQLEQPL